MPVRSVLPRRPDTVIWRRVNSRRGGRRSDARVLFGAAWERNEIIRTNRAASMLAAHRHRLNPTRVRAIERPIVVGAGPNA